MKPQRGEIWAVRFDPSVGAEMQKVRPAVVLSPAYLGRLPLTIVVPITDWKPAFGQLSWLVLLLPTSTNGLTKPSAADAFQVKSVSEKRLLHRIGVLEPEQVADITAAVLLCISDSSLD